MPKVSICIPAHRGMKNHDFFLKRVLDSIEMQTFKDYEVVITYNGKMAENTNSAMRKAEGEIIKILYLDDYFTNNISLQEIVDAFEANPDKQWLASGCFHDDGLNSFARPHIPSWGGHMLDGVNTIGSPSVVSLRKSALMYFDENLSWLLDCDLYQRLYDKYGLPIFLNTFNVTMGIGDHQMTYILTDEEKRTESIYLNKKYA